MDTLPPYLEILNPEQRAAALHRGPPLLILAGAGSGKTRVITTKIAYLIRELDVAPWTILAVTFTNKAAREMGERARTIDERAAGAMMRTFHSFGAWFLRRYGEGAAGPGGVERGFVIYDDDDAQALLATIMEGAPRADVKVMAHAIARAKDFGLGPNDPEIDAIDARKIFRATYAAYEQRLRQIGNVDFGDLIKKPVEILRDNPELAARVRGRFRVILVDEYQDANVAQFELLKELHGPDTYLCVVGDDDQSIYRFRGAEVRNILEFPDRFPGTEIIRLERNYRSTARILRAAASVVDHNAARLGKTLRAERGEGETPVLVFLPNQDEEAAYCARLIGRSVQTRAARRADWAVLYRTNAQSLAFETAFLRAHIPYRVVGSLKFYEREEIKDALALLSFLVNPRDEVAFRRVANKPARGLGAAAQERVVAEAGLGDIEAALRRLAAAPEGGLSAKARAGAAAFLAALDAGRAALTPGAASGASDEATDDGATAIHDSREARARDSLRAVDGLAVCVARLAETSGIAAYHLTHDEIAGNQRLSNLQELVNAASLYPATPGGLLEFLEHIELDRSQEEGVADEDQVTLITLHNTKGLEFRRVIMTGVEQGIFPRPGKEPDELEEERRLFYVGATRAMDELYFTTCAARRMYGRVTPMAPSMFLHEIDRSSLQIVGRPPAAFAPPPRPAAAPRRQTSSDGRWTIGDHLFHDDHGYGAVVGIREGDDGPVIRVRFETGEEARFLSLHQSRAYTKVHDDANA